MWKVWTVELAYNTTKPNENKETCSAIPVQCNTCAKCNFAGLQTHRGAKNGVYLPK